MHPEHNNSHPGLCGGGLRERLEDFKAQHGASLGNTGAEDLSKRIAIYSELMRSLVDFSRLNGVDPELFMRARIDLTELIGGDKENPKSVTRKRSGSPPADPLVRGARGAVAAIIQWRFERGISRTKTARWLASEMPARLRMQLDSPSSKTLDGWLTKCKSKSSLDQSMKNSYQAMIRHLAKNPMSDEEILSILSI